MKKYITIAVLIAGLSCNSYKGSTTSHFYDHRNDTLNRVIQRDSLALKSLITPEITPQAELIKQSPLENEKFYQNLLKEIRSAKSKIDTSINYQRHIISKEDSLTALVVAFHHKMTLLQKDTSVLRKTAVVSKEMRIDASMWNYIIQFCIWILVFLFLFSLTTMLTALWIAHNIRLKKYA